MVRVYEYLREKRITEITAMLKELALEGTVEPRKKLLAAICLKYNVSARTAADYLNAAQYQNELG